MKRIFYINEVRKLIEQYKIGEITIGRFVEILNEKATGKTAIELYNNEIREQSQPSGGRTFDQILEEDYHVQLEDNRRDESIKLAAEQYAQQLYGSSQPSGGKNKDEIIKAILESANGSWVDMITEGFEAGEQYAHQSNKK